jgi:hypothetical protein
MKRCYPHGCCADDELERRPEVSARRAAAPERALQGAIVQAHLRDFRNFRIKPQQPA